MGLPPDIAGGKVATFNEDLAGAPGAGNTKIADWASGSKGKGALVDALTPKASEIFEKRSATQIFVSHEDIALQSIQGGRTTDFSENENLYGFSIFSFNKGMIGGGWSAARANSLLASNIGSEALGNGDLLGTSSYFFNLHPKAMNISEPFATHIIPTQGGGMYVESQGVVIRTLTLSGTTGYRPAMTRSQSSRPDNVIPHKAGEPTGFMNILKLRNLFRNYSDLKKDKGQSYKIYMVWFNNKEQEAWFFEPTSFVTTRDAASPFTYNYVITGTLTQKVNFSSVVNTIHPDSTSVHAHVASMRRGASMINSIVGAYLPALGDDIVGDLRSTTTKILELVDKLDTTLTSIGTTLQGISGGVLAVGSVLGGLVQNAKGSLNKLYKDQKGMWGSGNVETWASNWTVTRKAMFELSHEFDMLSTTVATLSQPGAVEELERDQNRDSYPTTPKNRIMSPRGGGDTSGTQPQPFACPGPGTDLETWVIDILGDLNWLSWIIEFNGLDSPYITDTPTYAAPFQKFLTSGDIIYLPVPTDLVSGDNNVKINPLKTSLNVYEEAMGRDIKLNKSTDATLGASEFNIAISPTGDLAVVGGQENIVQAIEIKLHTERGELSAHPEFGLVPVMGRKGDRNLNFNLYLSLNDTMLSDGRIKELVDTKVNISGDIVNLKTKVHLTGNVPYVPVAITMTA